MSFEDSIKQWVNMDNEIRILNDKVKEIRNKKNELTDKLVNHATDNGLTHRLIEITDGNLKFQERKDTSPLTLKFIKQCLTETISDSNQVEQLYEYIKEKRPIRYVNELKRSYKN
tara:strand:- start:1305 stop:1649 length:345 start_codon:yes stop_codon:yes gene_type:complete